MANISFEKLGFLDNFRNPLELEYMKSVDKMADPSRQTIFLDPDNFARALKTVGIEYKEISSLKDLQEKMNALSPEQLASFQEELKKDINPEYLKSNPDFVAGFLTALLKGGPSSQKLGNSNLAVIPGDFMDSKEEYVASLINKDFVNAFLKNSNINDKDTATIIGTHEGAHLHGNLSLEARRKINTVQEIIKGPHDHLDLLQHSINFEDEVGASRMEIQQYIKDGRPDLASFQKDIRSIHLESSDTAHVVSDLLNSDEPPTPLHMIAAARVQYDLKDNHDLLKDDPEKYFKDFNERIEKELEDAQEYLEKYPDNTYAKKQLAEAQAIANYAHDFETAYRRRIMGQKDFPEYERVDLLSKEDLREVFYQSKKDCLLGALKEIREDLVNRRFADETKELDDLKELKQSDPQSYFEQKREMLEQLKEDALEKYKADSQENLQNLVETQYFIAHHAGEFNAELYVHQQNNDNDLSVTPILSETFVTEDQLRQYHEFLAKE
jgi:hypothetical protein